MSNGDSTLPPINPGDPSDLTKPTGKNSFANIDAKYNIVSDKLPPGVVRLERAPGQQFSDTPFNPVLDTSKTIGAKPWYMAGSADSPNTMGVGTSLATGLNVVDPRVTGKTSEEFYNDSMKFWEGTGDRWRNAAFGGMAMGINRLGQDFGALLGGSFWGEDFEKSAIEEYFATQAATTQAQTRIFNDSGLGLFGDAADGKFFEGLQSAIASTVEFVPIGGGVNTAVKGGMKVAKVARKLLRNADDVVDVVNKSKRAKRATQVSFGRGGMTQSTRVVDQVAENGTKIGNFFRQNQNAFNQIATAVPAGILQNRFEGTAMAVQTYEEVMEDLSASVEAGDLTYEQAQKIAGQEASGVRTANMAMMVQDIFQHALLFRARGATRTGYQRPGFTWNPKKYLQNAFQSTGSIRSYATSNFIVQGLGEALEEGYQSGLAASAASSARDSARELVRETGGDLSKVAPEFGRKIGLNAIERYMDHMSTDAAKFEMMVGFFAGAGQRMIQNYVGQARDTRKYNKYTKQIEALKRDLPTDSTKNRARREQKIAQLEYKRALETEKGRAEAAKNLLDTLKTGVKDAVLFSLETDELITNLTEENLTELAKGIEEKAFYQLFMKHAGNGTVDHLERHLQDIAEGKATSDMFPSDGSAKTRAKELLNELNRLEKDYMSLQGFTGAHKIMGVQETARINQKVVDANIRDRDSKKQEILEDLRKLSGSRATEIDLDLDTGTITMKDSLGRTVNLSRSMKAAIESSESYQKIFKDGGLNDQITILQDAVIEQRASLSEMISKPGQARLQREEEEFQREIAERQRQLKNAKRVAKKKKKGKKRSDRDRANLENSDSRTRSSSAKVDGEQVSGGTTLTPEANSESTERDSSTEETLANMGFTGPETVPNNPQNGDIKSDKDLQDEADNNHKPNSSDDNVFGYQRGERSSQNKIANLQLEYETRVEDGVIYLESTDINGNDPYLSLSDPNATKPGDILEFRVLSEEEAENVQVRDVSDDPDGSKQGTVKSVKSARQRKKELAEHETAISGETITEDQIIEDTTPIEIIAVRKDSNGNETKVVVGYLHTPLFEREARRDISEGAIASHKKSIREFRKKVIAGEINGGTISEVNTVRLNYVAQGQRRVTEDTFEGAELGKDYWVAVSNNGRLTLPGGSGINTVNGIGRNNLVNEEKLVDGVAYVVVPLTANEDGSINYYAAPLLTNTVTANNAEVMMAAILAFAEGGDAAKTKGAELGITLNESGLKKVLKRFIRVRGTENMPHKSKQSFIYEKTVEKNGKVEKRLVVREILDDQSETAFTEVEIIPGEPLGQNAAFVKSVLLKQMSNIDLDAVKEDKAYVSVIDTTTGKITTRTVSGAEYISKYTLATISPVKTADGKIPNGRVVYHLNPDVRFVTGVEGVDAAAAADQSPMRPDDAPDESSNLNSEEVSNAAQAYNKPEEEVTQEDINDLNEADDLLDGLGFDFEEDDDPQTRRLLPEVSTNRTEETRNRFNLEGLLPTQQEELINNFVGSILSTLSLKTNIREQADKETLFNEALEETISDLYNKLEKKIALLNKVAEKTGQDKYTKAAEKTQAILDSIKEQENKMVDLALSNLEQQSGVRKKKRRKKAKIAEDKSRKPALEDRLGEGTLDKLKKLAQELLGKEEENSPGEISEENETDMNEESGESAPGINKSYHSDGFYFTLDPVDTASSRLRQSLMTLPEVGSDGKAKKNFIGETIYGDPYQVFKLISSALSGTPPIFSKQIETLLRKYVQDRGFRNSASWLPALALNSATVESLMSNEVGKAFIEMAFPDADTRQERIDAITKLRLNPQVLNEFASVMAKHTLEAPMLSIITTNEGNTYVNVFSQNRNSADAVVREEFDKGMRERLYVRDAETGDYTINEEAFKEAIAFIQELKDIGGEISPTDLITRMNNALGVTISEDTAQALIEDGIRLSTNKNAFRVKLSDSSMFTSNNSPFVQLQKHLQELLDGNIPYSVKRASGFGGLGKLTRLEANRSSNKRHGSTFYAGGRNLATMTSNKYFSSMVDELFKIARDNESPLEAIDVVFKDHPIFSTIFESSSQMLNAILQGEITKEDLQVQYLNFTPLKQEGNTSQDFNQLQESQHIIVKNGLYTSSTSTKGTFTTSSGKVFRQRLASIVPLTYSDKDTVMALRTLVPIMKFDSMGQLDEDTIELFYDHVLLSEINRIKMFADNNADSTEGQDASESGVNNEELETGSSLFYLLPQFNSISVEFRGENVLLTDALRNHPTNEELADLKKSLMPALRTTLDEMVDDKLQEFQEDASLYDAISTEYKEMIASGQSPAVAMRMVAADITLGQALGTANTIQVFAGDPALYAKIKTDETGDVLPTATVKATYANIDKRLASLIAPGMDPSRKNDDEDYIQIMVPDIEMDYDSKFFEGLPDELVERISKSQQGIEATDAQEFVTWKEYLDNAVSFGEITAATADKVASVIRKYEKTQTLTEEDSELLKSVMFKAQKPVGVVDHYTTLKGSNSKVRQRLYVKTSAVPLLPMFTRGTQLDNLRKAMEKLQDDQGKGVRLTFKTGIKVGFPAASKNAKLTNNDGTIKTEEELFQMFRNGDENGLPYVVAKRKYWRIQQSVPVKKKDEGTRATQPDALIGSAAASIPEIQPLADAFAENSNRLFKLRADRLRDELMVDSTDPNVPGKVIDRKKLAVMLEEVAKERGFDFNTIEGLTVAEDGQFEIPAELSPASEQFQSMLLSIARKGIARKKVTGGSQVLMSEAMFRALPDNNEENEILYTTAYDAQEGLKPMRIEDGVVKPAQIVLPNKMRLPNGKVINFREYVGEDGRIDLTKLPEGALESFAYRIPTAGYNFMAAVEVVGFLPDHMGDIVIAPRSFMAQMGSDFDVDKLYDYFFKMEKKNGRLRKIDDGSELSIQNDLLQNRIDILKNKKVFALIKTPTDFGLNKFDDNRYTNEADAALQTEINAAGGVADAIANKKKKTNRSKSGILSEFYQRGKYLEARAALDAVGVKATLNSFFGVLGSTSTPISLTRAFTFGNAININVIEGTETVKGTGRLKQDVSAASLNSAVDNQNEQIVNKVNLNNVTFDAHDAMELLGFEEDFALTFLEQPIIKLLVQRVQAGTFNTTKGVTEELQSGILQEIAKQQGLSNIDSELAQKLYDKALKEFDNRFKDKSYDEIVAELWQNVGKDIDSGVMEDLPFALALLDKFTQLSGIMSDLRPAMRLLSADSKGAGSTITDFVAVSERADELLEDDYVTSDSLLGLFGQYVLENNPAKVAELEKEGYLRGPFITKGSKTGYLMIKPNSAKSAASFHTLSVSQDLMDSEFKGVFTLVRDISRRSYLKDNRDTKNIIQKGIRQYINSDSRLYAGTTLESLLYPDAGGPSLAQLVEAAKASPRLKRNTLIQELEANILDGEAHTLSYRNSASDDFVTDGTAKAFLDLLIGPKSNEVIDGLGVSSNQLGRMLIDYSFLTGGIKTAVDFSRFVPTSYLIDIGFFKNLKVSFNQLRTTANTRNDFVEQLMQNNPDIVSSKASINVKDGIVLDKENSNISEGIARFKLSKPFKEKIGVTFDSETGSYTVLPSYNYITIKPKNKPRRVLKFDNRTGNYIMLDNLGTNTISEFAFNGNQGTVLEENKVKNYLGKQEEEVDDSRFEEIPLPTAEDEFGGTDEGPIQRIPSSLESLGFTTSEDTPGENPTPNPIPPADDPAAGPENGNLTEEAFPESTEEEKQSVSDLGFDFGDPKPDVSGSSTEVSGAALTSIREGLESKSTVSVGGPQLADILEELRQSDDMAHKYLANEILDSGILEQKRIQVIFQRGSSLESSSTSNNVIIGIDEKTDNWDFEQSLLHEIGHGLTMREIVEFERNSKTQNPKVRKALARLEGVRQQFLQNLENLESDQLAAFFALKYGGITEMDSAEVKAEYNKLLDKIETFKAEGNVKGFQDLINRFYGATDLGEFVTLVMSNESFRQKLDEVFTIDTKGRKTDVSFLKAVMELMLDIFTGVLNLEKRPISQYALEQAMFVAKQDLPDIDPDNRPMVEEEPMIVKNRSYKIDGDNNVIALDGKPVNKSQALRVRANYAARDNRLGKVRLDNDVNTYMVFDTQDGIMVMKKTPKGTISEVTPNNKKYAEIIESGFQGGDNNLGGTTVTPVSPTQPKVDYSKEWSKDLKTRPVYSSDGVNTMRTENDKTGNNNFGNPWSQRGLAGTIKTASIAEAIQNYKDWLLGNDHQDVKPEQRAWILDQINQGKLDNAILLYAGKLQKRGEGTHAEALAEVVEQLRIAQPQVGVGETRLRESESGEQGISEAEKATIKAAMDAMLPPPDAFESREDYDQAEAEVKASKEYILLQNLERQLTGQVQQAPAPAAPKPVVVVQRKVEVTRSDIPSNLLGEQREAAQLIMDFLDDPDGPQEFSLVGKAGTGKTTTIASIIKQYKQKGVPGKIVIGALSHKATQVIEDSIKDFYEKSGESISPAVEFNTVASMMGLKLNEETNEFTEDRKAKNKLQNASIVIIDESSMINEEAWDTLMSKLPSHAKIIFLGDSGQLSPIRKSRAYKPGTGRYQVNKDAISPVFNSPKFGDKNSFKLLTRRRQGEDSSILPFADFFWEEAHKDSKAVNYPAGQDQRNNSAELKFVKSERDALVEAYPIFSKAVEDKNPNLIKIVAYKNATVKRINQNVRDAVLGSPSESIVPGEMMIASGSFIVESEFREGGRRGNNSNPIDPGMDINITNSTQIIVEKVSEKQTYEIGGKSFDYYMVEIKKGQSSQSVPVLDPKSVGKWNTFVSSLFDKAYAAKNKRDPNAGQLMGEAITAGYRTFAPFDYGYAITSHKSQGSGYDTVIVHEEDIYGVRPTSNAQKHRSMYTAITRARKNAIIIDRGEVKVSEPGPRSTPPQTQESKRMDGPLGDMGFTKGLVPLVGTVEDFLKKLDPNEVKAFREMSQNGELKTICKL